MVDVFEKIKLIQGGMGAGVSSDELANKVSKTGQLGVVSGTALHEIMIRKLQEGDRIDDLRRVFKTYPNQEFANDVIERYFIDGGKNSVDRYMRGPFVTFERVDDETIKIADNYLEELVVLANYAEVKLAKENHENMVGINYLHKIAWPMIPSIFGAMMAGVDVTLIGAGAYRDLPNVLESLVNLEEARMAIPVINAKKQQYISFNPKQIVDGNYELTKPKNLGIIASETMLRVLPNCDGYVLEGPKAGGHNAPARSKKKNERGEPLYGEKDEIKFDKLKEKLFENEERLGFRQPFWLAGGYANRLDEALNLGANGVQVGTPFAISIESKIQDRFKRKIIEGALNGLEVYTDPRASPSGYPFKMIQLSGTLSDEKIYLDRKRVCNLGFLVDIVDLNGRIHTRCSAEPDASYILKGGESEDLIGRKCLCNGLVSNIGLGSFGEPPLFTLGSDFSSIVDLHKEYGFDISAEAVVDYVMRNDRKR